MVIADNDTR
jgi:hypothetical protein